MPAAEIQVVGRGIDGLALRQAVLLCRRQDATDFLGDLGRDAALQRQHIAQGVIVAARPHMVIGLGVDLLRGDAHAIARPDDGALDDHVGRELARDLRHRFLRAAVLHDRRPRDDSQVVDLRQIGDQGLGHASAK